MKKITTVLLLVVMAVSLFSGCSKSEKADQEVDASVSGSVNESSEKDASSGDTQEASSEEPYEIIFEMVTLGQDFTSLAKMEEMINAITLPKINATVKFLPLHIADHATKLNLMVATGEKLDLVLTGITTPLAGLVAGNALLPLDEYLNDRAPELVEKQGRLLDAFRINGQIYSVSANLYPASSGGIMYNKDMADQYGIQIGDTTSLEKLTEIAPILKENGIYLTTPGDGALNSFGMYYPVSHFGGDYAYGAIFDPVNNTEIVNFYQSQEFKEYCLLLRDWYENGFIPADAMTNGQNGQDVFRSEQTFYSWTNVSPLDRVTQSNVWPFAIEMASTMEQTISTETVQEFGYGIPITCERPEVVIDFLNLIYTDAEISNILNNGIEGVEYQKVSDNIIKYVDGINFGNAGYVRIFNRYGDALQTYQWEPATEDYFTELKEYNENAKLTKTLGYVFDAQSVATELASVNSVVAEYRPALLAGVMDDVESALEDFNSALEAAGIEIIIEENRRQLGEWLASQN